MPVTTHPRFVWLAQAPSRRTTQRGPIFQSVLLNALFLIYSVHKILAVFCLLSYLKYFSRNSNKVAPGTVCIHSAHGTGVMFFLVTLKPAQAQPSPKNPDSVQNFLRSKRGWNKPEGSVRQGLTQSLSACLTHHFPASETASCAWRQRQVQISSCTLPSS